MNWTLIIIIAATVIAFTAVIFFKKNFGLRAEEKLIITFALLALTVFGVKTAVGSCIRNNYYSKIENLSRNGYIIYVDGSDVDFDKIVISDYPTKNIHINDERKEIYISAGTENK